MISRPNGRKLERAQGCGGPEDSLQDRELLVPTRSRFKFSFLIRRWEIKSKHYSYYPSLSEIYFLHETRGTSSSPSHFAVLLLTSRDTCSPFREPGQLSRRLPLRKGSDSSAESKNMVSITPDLNAVHRAQRCCRLLLQKLRLDQVEQSQRANPFIQNGSTKFLSICRVIYKFHHISSQVPSSWGGGEKDAGDVPPQHRVVFSPDQARLL